MNRRTNSRSTISPAKSLVNNYSSLSHGPRDQRPSTRCISQNSVMYSENIFKSFMTNDVKHESLRTILRKWINSANEASLVSQITGRPGIDELDDTTNDDDDLTPYTYTDGDDDDFYHWQRQTTHFDKSQLYRFWGANLASQLTDWQIV